MPDTCIPGNGKGMLVIAWRTDGKIDVYHQPGLHIDQAKNDIVSGGLASMIERPMEAIPTGG